MIKLNVQVHQNTVGTERLNLIPWTIGGAVLRCVEGCVRRPTLASLVIRRYHDKVPYCGLEKFAYLRPTLQVELASQAMAVGGGKLDCFREKLDHQAKMQRTDSRKEALLLLRRYLSFVQLRLELPSEDFQGVKHLEGQSAEPLVFGERLSPASSL